MSQLQLDKYLVTLNENEVYDVDTLKLLSIEDLKEMGFAIGARKKMIQRIEEL